MDLDPRASKYQLLDTIITIVLVALCGGIIGKELHTCITILRFVIDISTICLVILLIVKVGLGISFFGGNKE